MTSLDYRFMEVAIPIIEHEEYQILKKIKHHCGSVYEHSLNVAYSSYLLSYKNNLDWESTIRGALLHDFFLYKFNKSLRLNLIPSAIMHAIKHPLIAYENASKHFLINEKEENIIKSHMFPFGIPKSKEVWIVSYVDKYLAVYEYSQNFKMLSMLYKKEAFNTEI